MNNSGNEIKEYVVCDSYKGLRIDKYLSGQDSSMTRSYLQRLIGEGLVLVKDQPVKSNYKVLAGDRIMISIPQPEPLNIEPEKLPLSILYEDQDIIVVDKPKNMVVHPAPGHPGHTLVNGLMYHCQKELSGINGIMRPGIVHRIDRNTTGALVVCKNDNAHQFLAQQLKEHSITRRYEAIVHNHFKQPEGTVDAPIGRHPVDRKKMAVNYKNGRDAVTHYRVIKELAQNLSYIECRLETGRTHQIRVHMTSISHPLLGDDVYGRTKAKFNLEGQTLHARILGFIHPSTHEYMEFEAPLPEYFKELLNTLS